MFSFVGISIGAQDTTDVPEAAEVMAKAFEAEGITVQRTRSSGMEVNGNRASRRFDLYVSKKGDSPMIPRISVPLQIPRRGEIMATADVKSMSDQQLQTAARELAGVMREFETANQEHLAREWRADNQPISRRSYRYVFEEYRARAIRIRDEMLRRSGVDRAIAFALDADTLAGPSPITDAANYLDKLAGELALHRR
jgi:hypothetical protein